MPLPVIHSYAGYQIYKFSQDKNQEKNWKMAILFMGIANLADIDTLPGMLVGNAELFHRGPTHSLMAAFLVALGTGYLLKCFSKMNFWKGFWIALATYFSHVLLDYISGSVKFMLWPFHFQIAPMPITKALFERHEHGSFFLDCRHFEMLCRMLFCPTLVLRLMAEGVLVYFVFLVTRFIPGYRTWQPRLTGSPAFIAGLAIFLFVLTALVATQTAG